MGSRQVEQRQNIHTDSIDQIPIMRFAFLIGALALTATAVPNQSTRLCRTANSIYENELCDVAYDIELKNEKNTEAFFKCAKSVCCTGETKDDVACAIAAKEEKRRCRKKARKGKKSKGKKC